MSTEGSRANVIQPLVVGRNIELDPAVGVVAVDRLFGFVGLIVAVPILSTCKILVEELWIKPVEHGDRAFTGEVTSAPVHVVSVAGGSSTGTVEQGNTGRRTSRHGRGDIRAVMGSDAGFQAASRMAQSWSSAGPDRRR